jgi:hypothetical protein
MENVINELLKLMALFGVAILVVLGAGFWLFHRLKKDAEAQDPARRGEASPGPQPTAQPPKP